ncbi:MAG TPA: glycosyltransferase [Flavitalea sp.]|nr:glycosyltransferase [Flavitalea sp.]
MSPDVLHPKKVLHIIHGFGPGGVETWLLSTVKYLHRHRELNLQFDFLLTGGVPGIFDEEIKKYGCEIFYTKYAVGSLRSFRYKFRQILRTHNYIAVHNHEDFISGWHYLLGGNYLPAVRIAHLHNPYNFVHNYAINPVRRFSFTLGRKLMASYATKITGTSDAVMDEYGYDKQPFKIKRTAPAYCGFDTNKFIFRQSAKQIICKELNWDTSAKIALFAGRIGVQRYDTAANQKNPAFAFAIAKHLVLNNSEWNFIFVGQKGDTGACMEEETIEENLENRIKFLDIRHDIPQIMSASDALVFPSLWEGLGMVSVEAQCSGLKIIMSDTIPAEAIICPDLITVKKIDEGPAAWAEAIATTQLNKERMKYAGEISRSPFSIENSVKRLTRLYES